jgi:hypothetical protein
VSDTDLAALLAFFKAMANESRLRIVGLLAERERSVQELAELLTLKEPTVSHHLGALKALGIVSVRAEGVTRWHALKLDALTQLNRALLDQKSVAGLTREVSGDSWEVKVLASFVGETGNLAVIPASRRKRRIVLRWLAEQFEEDRRYRESEVNELLQRRHWDCATLRRELVGYGMLGREGGTYWRQPQEVWRD